MQEPSLQKLFDLAITANPERGCIELGSEVERVPDAHQLATQGCYPSNDDSTYCMSARLYYQSKLGSPHRGSSSMTTIKMRKKNELILIYYLRPETTLF